MKSKVHVTAPQRSRILAETTTTTIIIITIMIITIIVIMKGFIPTLAVANSRLP